MTLRSVGGADWFYDPVERAGQRGVAGGIGLNNIGLLVTTWGRVVSPGVGYFFIREGDGAQVKVMPPAGAVPPIEGSFVTVTGAV